MKDGYELLGRVLEPEVAHWYRNQAVDLYDARGTHPYYNGYADHVYNVIRLTSVFDDLYAHPRVTDRVEKILGHHYHLSQTELRSTRPDAEPGSANVWHQDSKFPADGLTVLAFWALDNVTLENGATQIRSGIREITLTLEPGEVALMDANTFHRSQPNLNGQSRWLLIVTYVRWWMKPSVDHTQIDRPYLTPLERQLYGLTSRPPWNTDERILTCE